MTDVTDSVATANLLREMQGARQQTGDLFRLLSDEALYERPVADRHRLIFYLGHLEAFDWNLLGRDTLGLPPFDAARDRLFAFGIDPEPGQAPADQPADWPAVSAVREYGAKVRRALDGQLDECPAERVQVAIEHRLMHAETLAYLLHDLPHELKRDPRPAAARLASAGEPVKASFVSVPAGVATLGQEPGEFGWDNEFDRHAVAVPGFAIQRHKVTNGEYREFADAGGPVPHFWVRRGDQWHLRRMFDEVPLSLDHPVQVTHDQAAAYAAWRGLTLPTEVQFHRVAYGTPEGAERRYPWGEAAPSATHGWFDAHGWDTVPVNAHPCGTSAFGVAQLVGNGWEWTGTPFGPFAGFAPRSYYPGYSANFFDGRHFVLKGGSCRTAVRLLRRSFRNWFRPEYRHAYATFRCVRPI